MTMLQSLTFPHDNETEQNFTPTWPLRILLIGPELRVEELHTLLSKQEDMKLLPPIADPSQALDVLISMNRTSPVDVGIIEWEFCEEKHYHLLQTLSRQLRCLIITPPMYPSETKRLEEAGAWGCCPTAASSQQLVKAIRKIARGEKYFHPTHSSELRA